MRRGKLREAIKATRLAVNPPHTRDLGRVFVRTLVCRTLRCSYSWVVLQRDDEERPLFDEKCPRCAGRTHLEIDTIPALAEINMRAGILRYQQFTATEDGEEFHGPWKYVPWSISEGDALGTQDADRFTKT